MVGVELLVYLVIQERQVTQELVVGVEHQV